MANTQLGGTVKFFHESRVVVFQAVMKDAGTVAPATGWVILNGDTGAPRLFQPTSTRLIPLGGSTTDAGLVLQGEYADAPDGPAANGPGQTPAVGTVTAQLLTTITNYPPPPPPPPPPLPHQPPPPPPPPKPPVTYAIDATETG